MIVDNRITEYLHSLEKSRGELLDTIEKKAVEKLRKAIAARENNEL